MHCHRVSFLVLSAAFGLTSVAHSQATTFHQGRITFTQGGKEATWLLSSGDLTNTTGANSMLMASLQYTPEGKPLTAGGAHFALVFGKMGDIVSIASLAVLKGPAGDGVYRLQKASCTLRLTRLQPAGIEGTGACTGQFEGTTISKLTFSAAP